MIEPSEPAQPCREFVCQECGRRIIVIAEPEPIGDICLTCRHVPGWYRDPQLRRFIDPDGTARPRRLS